jgi:hypothetical protein
VGHKEFGNLTRDYTTAINKTTFYKDSCISTTNTCTKQQVPTTHESELKGEDKSANGVHFKNPLSVMERATTQKTSEEREDTN